MRKKLFLLIAFISNLIAGYSAKMHPSIVTIKQKDGTELRIKFWGDEDFSYATTVDGVILYQLENDFFIASVTEDGALKPTNILAHELSQRTQAENIAISKQDLDIFRKNFEEERAVNKVRREPLTGNSTLFPHKGSPKAPVILVEFSDFIRKNLSRGDYIVKQSDIVLDYGVNLELLAAVVHRMRER